MSLITRFPTILIFFLILTTSATAQFKIHSTYISIGGNRITLKPANPGPEIGGTDGTKWSTISFWHTQSGWNHLLAKKYKTISDTAFKTNILPLDSATQILRQITSYSYNFKEDEYTYQRKEYGLLAQNLQRIIPDLVEDVNGYLCLDYDELIPFLIKGFNEQQEQLENYKIEIDELRALIETQQKQINSLINIIEDNSKRRNP